MPVLRETQTPTMQTPYHRKELNNQAVFSGSGTPVGDVLGVSGTNFQGSIALFRHRSREYSPTPSIHTRIEVELK